MKSKILIFLLVSGFMLLGATSSAVCAPVFLDGVSSTSYYDADKDGGDGKTCWAAAGANVLAWSGWGALNTNPALSDGTDEELVFDHLKAHFGNVDKLAEDAWKWWFTEPGLGSYSFNDYYSAIDPIDFDNPSSPNYSLHTDDFIQDYIGTVGYGTVLSIQKFDHYEPDPLDPTKQKPVYLSHAITLWGYNDADSDGTLDTIYITDSDDSGLGYTWRSVGFLIGSDKGSLSKYDDVWFLDGFRSTDDWWFVTRLQGLFPYGEGPPPPPPGEPVPEPATIFLLGSGLAGLFGIGRRKFKRS